MIKIIKLSAAISLITLMAGCGGSSSGDSSSSVTTPTTSTTSVAGTAADGYLSGATVCLDQDGDGSCTGESITGLTGAGGTYSLEVPADVDASLYSIIVEVTTGTIDEDDPTNPIVDGYTLSSPPGKPEFISPLTTLINNIIQNSTPAEILRVENQLKDQLGISDTSLSLYQDYVSASKTGNDTTQYTNLYRTAQLLAKHFATTEKQLANKGATKSQIAKATSSLASDQLSTISGVVSSDPATFNLESAFAQQLDTWKAKAGELASVDDFDKLISRSKVPKLVSTGIFKFVDNTVSPTEERIELNIDFFGKSTDLANWNIQVLDASNLVVHTFSDADIDTVFAREGRVAYEKEVVDLSYGDYKFVAVAKDTPNAEPIELVTNSYSDTSSLSTVPMDDSLTGDTIYYRIDNQYDDLMVSVPQADIDTHYLATIWDENDNFLDANGWRKGKNYFYFDSKHEDKAAYILVYARSGDTRETSSLIYTHLRKSLTRTQSSVELTYGRARFHTGNAGSSDSYNEVSFNMDMEAVEDQQIPSFNTLEISQYDGSAYQSFVSCDNPQSAEEANCNQDNANSYPEFFQGNGTGWSAHYQGIYFPDYLSQNKGPTPSPQHYRVTITDTDSNKDVFYLNLAEEDLGSAAAAININQLQMDNYPAAPVSGLGDLADGWINGTITNPVDGYNYRVDFRVEYMKSGTSDLKNTYVTKTTRSPSGVFAYPVALLKSKVEARIANLKLQGHTPTQLLVRLNVSDGASGYLENNTWYTPRVSVPYFAELF